MVLFESRQDRIGDFERFAVGLERQHDSLAASVLERVRAKDPTLDRAGDVRWEHLGEHTRESLRVQLRSFRQGLLPERCPDVDAAVVAELARLAELELLLNGYRSAQMTLWGAWFAIIEDSPQLQGTERRELLTRGSDFFFRYADLLCDYVAEAYRREVDLARGSGAQRRFRAVRDLLDGDSLAASWLDLQLDRHHLGLVAWGEDPLGVARQLATELGRPAFTTSPPEPVPICWAWISSTRPLEQAEQRHLKCFKPTGGRIALGLEAFGESGFRATHRQAIRARRFAAEQGPSALHYEDVVVEVLASENEDDARAFVAHELQGIEDDSQTSCRLRETLRAYFAAEHNAASAAATLGVHQQTVANRLRSAEERLPHHSIGVRRVELEIALRLRSCLVPEHAP